MDGLLIGPAEGAVVVRLDDGTTRSVRIDEIERVTTRFEWGPTPKPGSAPKSAGSAAAGAPRTARSSAPAADDPATPTESEAS